MWYPFVEAKIEADRMLDTSLAELGYELDLSHHICFGLTGMTYNIKGRCTRWHIAASIREKVRCQ